MKRKVKIFNSTYDDVRLETQMNEWLAEHSNVAIIDIQYSISQCGSSGGSVYYNYSALIHYNE